MKIKYKMDQKTAAQIENERKLRRLFGNDWKHIVKLSTLPTPEEQRNLTIINVISQLKPFIKKYYIPTDLDCQISDEFARSVYEDIVQRVDYKLYDMSRHTENVTIDSLNWEIIGLEIYPLNEKLEFALFMNEGIINLESNIVETKFGKELKSIYIKITLDLNKLSK